MDFIAFLFLLLVCSALTLTANYYRTLFMDGRQEYSRGELLGAVDFLLAEWNRMLGAEISLGYLAFAVSALLGFLLSYTGGIYGESHESHLFHSAFLPLLLFFGLPFFREQYSDVLPSGGFAGKLIEADIPFFFGFSMATMAQNFASFGLYHSPGFLWVFVNGAGIIALVMIRFFRQDGEPEPESRGGDDGEG